MEQQITKYLSNLESKSGKRTLPKECDANHDGYQIDMLSNDYLGLSSLPEIKEDVMPRFLSELKVEDMSASASRLLCRNSKEMFALENQISKLFENEALIFNSGYHANVGTISALAALGNTLFLCDKYIHASIIDGLAMCDAKFQRFRHNDINGLERLLEKYASLYSNIIIVTEGIFSMTGDCAPIREIVDLKKRYNNVAIYLDEAHSFGVIGNKGMGLAQREGVAKDIDIRILTFGKALSSSGAAAITSAVVKEWLVNNARSLIFSTALPPICCKWTSKMIELMVEHEDLRQHLNDLSDYTLRRINEATSYNAVSSSQIIPIVTGDAQSACLLAEELKNNGIDVLPIRRPTVPPGHEGVRLSLSARHSFLDIDRIIEALK